MTKSCLRTLHRIEWKKNSHNLQGGNNAGQDNESSGQSSSISSSSELYLPYARIIKIIVESALVNWIGLLFYQVASIAPQGRYTVRAAISVSPE